AVFTGIWRSHPWQHEKIPVDFYTAKGVLEGLFAYFGLGKRVKYIPSKKEDLHPGRTAAITLNQRQIGFIGQVHPSTAKKMDVHDTFVFELELAPLLEADKGTLNYQPLPRFPSVTRDIALVVDEEV